MQKQDISFGFVPKFDQIDNQYKMLFSDKIYFFIEYPVQQYTIAFDIGCWTRPMINVPRVQFALTMFTSEFYV